MHASVLNESLSNLDLQAHPLCQCPRLRRGRMDGHQLAATQAYMLRRHGEHLCDDCTPHTRHY